MVYSASDKFQLTAQPVELLAPAGNWEKMEIAVHFGADAVYLSGRQFSLRNLADNFSNQELADAVVYCHDRGVKVYAACNAFVRNADLAALASFLKTLASIGPDAVIVADPGVLTTVRQLLPAVPIHLSTQANTTNYQSALFWKRLGVARINAARELTLAEIEQIARHSDMEVEAFVHGAMCMAYSGRCFLSSHLARRDGNRGRCAQACRWNYALVEEARPGQYFPVEEDSVNAYILSADDLCMIDHIPAMINAGITTFKIEGRMKGIGYLGPVVKTYREAIDSFRANPGQWQPRPEWLAELNLVSHRPYSTGFFLNGDAGCQDTSSTDALQSGHLLVGKVLSRTVDGRTRVDIRTKINAGDLVSILKPGGTLRSIRIDGIADSEGSPVSVAHPGTSADLQLNASCNINDLIRRETC